MNHSDYQIELSMWDSVVIKLDRPALVMLMDDKNYANYLKGSKFRYYGGHTDQNTMRIPAPNSGHWHVIIKKSGSVGPIKHSIQIIRN
ncbi:DUF1883 domain-containing protein [Bacillus testis]|uniref:DUF1883 domain-containing protein n=1 Tax=Bacillus testis TaxID=1622072 RepID=UPI00067EDAB1|nr:DUF1883 domain-containing protein [Bacillus testis]